MMLVEFSLYEVLGYLQIVLVIALLVLGIFLMLELRRLLRAKRRLAEAQRMQAIEETILVGTNLATLPPNYQDLRANAFSSRGWDVKP